MFNSMAPESGLDPNASPDVYGMTLYIQMLSFTSWSLSFSSVKWGQEFPLPGVLELMEPSPKYGSWHTVTYTIDGGYHEEKEEEEGRKEGETWKEGAIEDEKTGEG